MQPVIKSLNNQTVIIGPFANATDGVTPMGSLTITNNDLKVLKHGATAQANSAGAGATHIADGYYYFNLMAGDTDTYERLRVTANMAGAVPVWEDFEVMNATMFNALFGNNNVPSDVQAMASNVLTATAFNQGAADKVWATTARTLTASDNIFSANAITASSFNQAAADKVWATAARTLTANTNLNIPGNTQISGAVWDTARASFANAGSFGEGVASVQGNVTGTLSALAANSVTAAAFNQGAADKVWATAARTLTASDNIFSSNAITAASFNQAAADKIWASSGRTLTSNANLGIDTALGTYDAPTKAEMDSAFSEIKGATFNNTTDSLEAIRDRGDGAWITATGFSTHNANDVWGVTNATLSLTYGVMFSRLIRFLMNKMNITDATGAVALRNEADDADIATQTISDNSTTTVRTALSWS